MAEQKLSLFGDDLFGCPILQPSGGPLADRYTFPPFSVLDGRCGPWLDRKRAWKAIGIESELGREDDLRASAHDCKGLPAGTMQDASKTSVFDPVLTELAYTWFCPPGGQIVDPFAGGSVRGIVASALSFRYWGCDLAGKQIEANRVQAATIWPEPATVAVRVSRAMLMQRFMPCEPEYITTVCKGRCCDFTTGLSVVVYANEQHKVEALDAEVREGLMVPRADGKCPFKQGDGLCSCHGENQPLACRTGPFVLTAKDTLVVRNRHRRLRCYNRDGAQPAYISRRWSLAQLLGDDEAARVCRVMEAESEGDIAARMPYVHYAAIKQDEATRQGKPAGKQMHHTPAWLQGDSMEELANAPRGDFLFSCPPYGDLERYSDHPRDLSTMEWHTFTAEYGRLILRAVKQLKENRFACFVVGNFRDKNGWMRDLVGTTVAAFNAAGAKLYNRAVLLTMLGTAPVRANGQFVNSRKLVTVHQDVLIFCKGDWKAAASAVNADG